MAVFFDHHVQLPYPGQVTDIQWHKTHPLLAIACISQTNGATVTICQEEGEPLPDAVIRRTRMATTLAWHPARKVLAIGWETGEIVIRSEQDKETVEVARIHKAEITIMHWTLNGMRLLTGDASGLLVMWKADTRGYLQVPLFQKSLGEPLTHVVITPPPVMEAANDLLNLARAAVGGDEKALDMFTWQKGKTDPKLSAAAMGVVEASTFFVGSKNGSVYYIGDNDKVNQPFTAEGAIKKLLYYDDKSTLVTITSTMMLTLHSVSGGGEAKETLKVKLNGKPENADIVWAGKGILATCTGERFLRMWDLEKDENYVLELGNGVIDPTETIICCAFSPVKGVLAGGMGNGKIALWKYSAPLMRHGRRDEPEDCWQLQVPASVGGPVSDLVFGSSKSFLAVNTIEHVFILNEQEPCGSCCQGTAAVQTGTMQLSVDIFSTSLHYDLKTDIQVKGAAATKTALAIRDGKRIVVYEISEGTSEFCSAGSFNSMSSHMCIYEQNIYTLEPGKIQVRNFQGTVKQLLPLPDTEDVVVSMVVCSQYLVVATAAGAVKIFDLSRREAKQHAGPKYLQSSVMDFGKIISAKCNATGSKVSIIVNKVNNSLDSNVYIWDIETDTIQFFNFSTGHDEADDYVSAGAEGDAGSTLAEKGKNQSAKDVAGRRPVSHFWDLEEPRLLVCEAELSPTSPEPKKSTSSTSKSLSTATMDDAVDLMVVSLFCTTDNGILIQDSFSRPASCESLLALEIPFYFFKKKADFVKNSGNQELESTAQLFLPDLHPSSMVRRRLHRDFVGLEKADKAARDAMMNFSFFLTMGDMDEAFKAIKVIKSESVWENMAKMCVKTRRLDVARVCLGHMGHARGAQMLREVATEPELDAQIAVLAIHLGLDEDAERLLKNCKRYDLLNNFYQSHADWEKAIGIAEMYDRIHLRSTCYNYAKYLESQDNYAEAIKYYEKSGTHSFEVPRMLYDDLVSLENYINKSKDKALHKWWAQFQESNGEMDVAMKYYHTAQDFLSLVRIYCFMNNVDKAAEVCSETGDRAACYHVARQFENNEQYQEAINFFTRAQAYGNAIRLCKEHGFDDKLLNMALLGKPDDMVEAARYYEFKPGHQDKAVMLYHKAGYFSKALELAFSSKEYSALQMVSESLDESTDPQLLQRCADFFIDNSQFDRAVDLLAAAKRYWDALKICMEQHVPMTEDLVEKLTPSKEMEERDVVERNKILEGIGEVCMAQRQYHLATKKFTQAGNRVKAMKALLKSGDTEKIMFFATVSRQREIYIMAAHYLQTLDWQKDPEIMKNIITFYTKGRAPEPLAGFYDACAQLEIDEFQNYEKALGAMGEAYKCLSKVKPEDQHQSELKLGDLKNRMTLINRFIKAKSLYGQNSEEAVKQCQSLLTEPGYDRAVRPGDIFGFLAEHFARCEKWKMSYNCIEEIRNNHSANISYYVSARTIEAVYRALDIPLKDTMKMKNVLDRKTNDEEDGEVVDADIIDD